ncbi:MAG: LUD domain-containing protein [Proteobacteria bacterium]|nr:LUD domain-containing protein [Pseudomonadota bacterium]
MSSRAGILKGIKKLELEESSYPVYDFSGSAAEVNTQKFFELLALIGGSGVSLENTQEIAERIKTLPYYQEQLKIYSEIPGLSLANVSLEQFAQAKELYQIGLAIVRGEIAVQENGAIWVNPQNYKHRAILFAAEHLIIVVSRKNLVLNMEQAYSKIDLTKNQTGYFIAGPSKTADIEQCLVIGAQGAKSLNVFLTND